MSRSTESSLSKSSRVTSRLTWSLAWKDIKYAKVFTFLFLINMSIGLLGLVVIENFKVSFQQVLDSKAQNLLGADLEVSGRFPLNETQKSELEGFLISEGILNKDNISVTKGLSLFSMARGQNGARLISLESLDVLEIKNHSDFFPYYGYWQLDHKTKFPIDSKEPPAPGTIWAYPDVVELLGTKNLKLGGLTFKVSALVTDDTQQAFDMGPLAPKIFIRSDDLDKTGLIRKGSTLNHHYHYKTLRPLTEDDVTHINELLDDNAIRVKIPNNSSQQVGRILSYLSDFLGLVSLVALFLSSVGLFYLYRSHLAAKRYSLAIYSSIGLNRSDIFKTFMKHIFILSGLGTLLGIGLSLIVIPSLNQLLLSVLPFELPFMISSRAIFTALLVGLGGVTLLSYPLILAAISGRPASLFQEVSSSSYKLELNKIIHFIPYTLFFAFMSIYCANSFRVGGVFLLIFIVSIIVGIGVALVLIRGFNTLFNSTIRDLRWSLSWKYLSRHKVSTLSIFLSLLLGSMLLNLIPLLEESIHQELDVGKTSGRPSLFLFDIQDEQVEPLRKYFEEDVKEPLLALSPLIRARISKINDEEVKVDNSESLTREQEREKRFRNRGTNLSYRRDLTSSEELVEGPWFSGPYNSEDSSQSHPYISIEARYASRLGIERGDVVEFSVMGIPVTGEVLNLRKVKWTSFLPNFFIQFQPGVLDDAPKTWLASIGQIKDDKKLKIQRELFEVFPNVSAVDLSKVVNKILTMMEQMGLALKAMSLICVVVGLFVLYSLSHHQVNSRLKDFALLKVMGMKEKDLKTMALREFAMIGFIASFLGAFFSLFVANIVSKIFFDGNFVLQFLIPVGSIFVITFLCYLTSRLAIRKVLKVKANHFL